MSESKVVSFIDVPKTNPSTTKREIVLMGESNLGERINGNRFFEANLGTFGSVKDAEVFGERHFRNVRWLVGERTTQDGKQVTYDFKSKPRSPRYND